jgi:hypothetical protein
VSFLKKVKEMFLFGSRILNDSNFTALSKRTKLDVTNSDLRFILYIGETQILVLSSGKW